QPDLTSYQLKVSQYDRVASLLLALLTLIGAAVLMLVVIWLTNQIFSRQTAVPVQMEEIGTGDATFREGPELDEPTPEELREEVDMTEPVLGDTLSSISDVVSTNASMLDDPSLGRSLRPGGRRVSGGRPGRPRQWEVRFGKGNTLDNYAKQLDFFGIELGVLMPGNKVLYAYDLSKAKPSQRTGPADEEKRYYLTWRHGELQEADRELLQRAGIPVKDKIILKFLPPELEGRLVEMEKRKAGSELENVRTTYFTVRPTESGYEFYLTEQTYQWGKGSKPKS
ncbi:MAG: hypothetical protein ABIK89_07350, partial [Planctomycetota bacterium]